MTVTNVPKITKNDRICFRGFLHGLLKEPVISPLTFKIAHGRHIEDRFFLFFYWILGFDMRRLLYRLGYTCLDSAAAEALISCQASYLSQNFTKTSSALLLLSFLWRCWLDVSKGELAYKNTAWVMSKISLTLYGHIKTTERRTVIQQYDDWYTGRSLVGCYIWYSEEGSGQAGAPHRSLLPVPNVTAHRSTTSVPDRAEHHIKVVRYNRTVEIIVHL